MRKFWIQVKPGAKQHKVQPLLDGSMKVWVKAPAKQGKANKEVIELLADYFSVSKSQIVIDKGLRSRKKLIIIDN